MMRVVLLFLFLIIAGCVNLPTSSLPESSQLKERISQLESELGKQKEENLSLKQQLEATQKTEIRMPTASQIQTALRNAGFYQGKVDGQIGTQTKEAIKKFQEANGINPDGVVGSRTWEILVKSLNPKLE